MKVEIYEPPMCCPSGLCGPTVDPALVAINDAILQLQKEGVEVKRYMINQNPSAFKNNAEVMNFIKKHGSQSLPLTLVDGQIIKSETYPTYEEIKSYLKELIKND